MSEYISIAIQQATRVVLNTDTEKPYMPYMLQINRWSQKTYIDYIARS